MSYPDDRFDYITDIFFPPPTGTVYDEHYRKALFANLRAHKAAREASAAAAVEPTPPRSFVTWGPKPAPAPPGPATGENKIRTLLYNQVPEAYDPPPAEPSSSSKFTKLKALSTPDWTRKPKPVDPADVYLPGYLVYLPPGSPTSACTCRDCEYKRRFIRETPQCDDYRCYGTYASHGRPTCVHSMQAAVAAAPKGSWLQRNVAWKQSKSHT